MKELFTSSSSFLIFLITLFLIGVYREWEEGRLIKELKRVFCEKKLINGKEFSIRQLDIFLYHFFQRFFNYIFRGFFTRQILNQYIIFPLAIILSVYVWFNLSYENKIQDLILLITFMSILWYSKETFALREEQKNSLKFEQRPCLIPRVVHMGQGEYQIKIKNIGRGIAVDICFKIIVDGKSSIGSLYRSVKFMSPNNESSIEFPSRYLNKKTGGSNMFNNTSLYQEHKKFKVIIFCKDANNNPLSNFEYEIRSKEEKWEVCTIKIGKN